MMIYQDAIKESGYKSSSHDVNKEDQGNNENEQGQKLSGAFSTEKKNNFFVVLLTHTINVLRCTTFKNYIVKTPKIFLRTVIKIFQKCQPLIINLP